MIRAADLDFFPVCQEQYPAGELVRQLHRLSLVSGAEALECTIQIFVEGCRAAFEDGPRAMDEMRVDGLVLDQLSRGFDLVAMHRGIPYVHVSNALHLDYSGHTPLGVFDWPYETGPAAFARNRQGVESMLKLTATLTEAQREYGERVGLTLTGTIPTAACPNGHGLLRRPGSLTFPAIIGRRTSTTPVRCTTGTDVFLRHSPGNGSQVSP